MRLQDILHLQVAVLDRRPLRVQVSHLFSSFKMKKDYGPNGIRDLNKRLHELFGRQFATLRVLGTAPKSSSQVAQGTWKSSKCPWHSSSSTLTVPPPGIRSKFKPCHVTTPEPLGVPIE